MKMKSYVKRRWPSFFQWARSVKDQALIEVRTIRSVGVRALMTTFVLKRPETLKELPVQCIKSIKVTGVEFSTIEELVLLLGAQESGAHSIYLSPGKWAESVFSALQSKYPIGCGLKIRKVEGNQESKGLSKENSGRVQNYLVESHRGQLLVSNYLTAKGISPRLYDVLEIEGDGCTCMAYITEHLPLVNSDLSKCLEIVDALKKETQDEKLRLVNWNGFDDDDFLCPECNRNLYLDVDGQPKYVDTQNFSLGKNFDRYLRDIVEVTRETSHFGQKSVIYGGKYLYQKMPGLNYPAKRDPELRALLIDEILETEGLSIEDAVVVDVGCNIGLMGAQYLKRGAHWVHGIDMPAVVEKAQAVSLAIGLTRFSFRGCIIDSEIDILQNAPHFYEPGSFPLWISYLAIRGHVGWVDHLGSVKWDYLLYEGHEKEDIEVSREHLSELNRMVNIQILAERQIADGASDSRYVALIERIK